MRQSAAENSLRDDLHCGVGCKPDFRVRRGAFMTYHDYDVAWVVAVTRKLCQMRLTLKQVVGAWPREDGPPSLRSPVLLASICFKSVFLRSACRPPWPGTEKIRPLEFEGDSAGPRLR